VRHFVLLGFIAVGFPSLVFAGQRRPAEFAPPGAIVVKVRTAAGVPLDGAAMVRLSAPVSSIEMREPTGEGAQARFAGLPPGDYLIEVTAPGYSRAEERTEVVPGTSVTVFVLLRPEGSGTPGSAAPAGTVLSPKARKELEKGVAALNAGNLKEAREHLEKVLKIAPGHPEPHYLLAVVAFREKDAAGAEARLKNALNLNPTHAGAHSLMGRILLQRNDYAGAIRSFDSALAEDPSPWETHALLATACLQSSQFERARTHAARALEQAGGQMPQLRLTLAEALLAMKENDKVVSELEAFLAGNPNHPAAAYARQLLSQARPAPAPLRNTATPAALARRSIASEVPAPEERIAEGNWAPRDVDETKPYVARDVSCALPQVLQNAGKRVLQLAENLQGVTASEKIDHAELDPNGVVKSLASKTYVYMVSIHKVGSDLLSVEEMRDGRLGYDNFPTQLVTRGLAALALIFHPSYARDLEFKCEGLGQWKGQPVWQVYFKQRPDREERIRVYRTRQGRFTLSLKGRAWIAANSWQILRLETDLVAPLERAELEREHITVDYQPVAFKQRNLRLWLPERAELFTKLGGKRYRQRHMFSNFTYFSVETRQKISDPKLPPEPPNPQ
jgi:tetratricopeptide (TPR) repeat protein